MKILNQEQAKNYQIPSLNRGHIVFTSLVQINQKILFLNSHLERLLKGADFLFPQFNWKSELGTIRDAVIKELSLTNENVYLRLTIFDDVLHIEKKSHEVADENVKLMKAFKLKTQSLFPDFLKQSNYLESDLELRKAKEKGFDDVLYFDVEGNIAEATSSNIFIVTAEGILKTNPASSYVLRGITREKLSECLTKNGFNVQEQILSQDDLEKAREIWLTNSVKGLRFVSQFQEMTYEKANSHYNKCIKIFGRYGENYE
jgi:branched-subunit amino acid aminotransferase/4-amino-4-deoxychorismate lyase